MSKEIVKVREARTYSEHSPYSYYLDLALRTLTDQQRTDAYQAATERLAQHAREIQFDAEQRTSNASREYARRSFREVHRQESETRAMSSASTSGGDFVAPQYLIDQWITFRSPDRTFTNQCTTLPLPSYGLTFNIPSFASPGAGAQQLAENTGSASANPSGEDISVSLDTFSGYIPVSQQLIDRAGFQGQGGGFDSIVIQQSRDALYASIDTYLQAQALTNANAVTNNSGPLTIPQFYLDFATARNYLADTAGTRKVGTHLFTTNDFFGWVTSQVDDDHRPIVVPDPAALAAVSSDPLWTNWTGIYLPGNYRWFTDDNTSSAVAPSTETTVLVGSTSELLVWLGDIIPYTAIQTFAGTLSVLCGLRQYAAAVPKHNAAFAYITGSAYPTSLM